MKFAPIILLFLTTLLQAQTPEIALKANLTITQSCNVKSNFYRLNGAREDVFAMPVDPSKARPVIVISGDNLTVDFQHAILIGSGDQTLPNGFYGLGILIRGKNITLKNAQVKGYKVALMATDAEGLTLENCDFSYNYRPKLRSGREHEDVSDWLSYHQNDHDEWLRYGAGIYLKNCTGATVKGCTITGCQNALLMTGCSNALVYNNFFTFNSGLGIGLYRSSNNRIMHNRLDWNVRGYSNGFYQRGQDSAAILVYEQSSNNLIAYNSATHSGDGLFLWAGQSTMDSGTGGCNDNWVFGNDFSCAPTNGVEVTFSRNHIQGNFITECTYGIWGGYSYESVFNGNLITNCQTGIAIEHGQNDTIRQNYLENDSTGIALWSKKEPPGDWGYAKKRDVRSRDVLLDRNVFMSVRKPLKISNTLNTTLNGVNLFCNFEQLLEAKDPNEKLKFWRNDLYAPQPVLIESWKNTELFNQRALNFDHPNQKPADPFEPLMTQAISLKEPDSLKDGMLAVLPAGSPHGRKFILIDEWGPYDFHRPLCVLDAIRDGANGKKIYAFRLLGPKGSWRLEQMRGFVNVSSAQGTLPAEITLERAPDAEALELGFEFNATDAVTDVFGRNLVSKKPFNFNFRRFEKKWNWQVDFFNYDDATDPILHPDAFAALLKQKPAASQTTPDLYYTWWNKPAEGVQPDRFATRATTSFEIAPGQYTLELSSDDGARLYLDGKRLIDHWNVHEPETDEITVTLGGKHTLLIEHFDATGFATLGLKITETPPSPSDH
jgi:parallel beta-helix repeat protein